GSLLSPFHDRTRQNVRVDLGQHVEPRQWLVGRPNDERRVARTGMGPGPPGIVALDWLHRERRRLDVPRVRTRIDDDAIAAGKRCANRAGDRVSRVRAALRLISRNTRDRDFRYGGFLHRRTRAALDVHVECALSNLLVVPPHFDPDAIAHRAWRKGEFTLRLRRFLRGGK